MALVLVLSKRASSMYLAPILIRLLLRLTAITIKIFHLLKVTYLVIRFSRKSNEIMAIKKLMSLLGGHRVKASQFLGKDALFIQKTMILMMTVGTS